MDLRLQLHGPAVLLALVLRNLIHPHLEAERMRKAGLLVLLIAGLVAGSGTVVFGEEGGGGHREFYIKSANPDGTLNCAKWCNPTEPCC